MARPGDPRSRQLALVAVCLLGLLVAAFAAPTISASGPGIAPPPAGGGGGGGGGSIDDGGGGDGGGGGGAGLRKLLRWLLQNGSASERRIEGEPPEQRRTPPEQPCQVQFRDEPLPGQQATVIVTEGFDEIEDARVWLNGEFVGTTDSYGTVQVRVPYRRRLVLNARLPNDAVCSRVARTDDLDADAVPGGVADAVPSGSSIDSSSLGLADTAIVGDGPLPASSRQSAEEDNVTKTYTVNSPVEITVEGRPIPGETVTIAAQVQRAPMRKATVEVDGQTVGRTDTDGEYDLSVPTDGRRAITVRVSRGDFSGTRRIKIARLTASLQPTTIVAIPGGDTRLSATLGEEPVAGAVVRYDGKTLGETNAQGKTVIPLPADPTATITVEAVGQRATKSVLPLYVGTAIIGMLVVVGVVLVLAVVVFGVAWFARRARWLGGATLGLATRLERAVAWLGTQFRRLRAWLADLLATGRRSVPALFWRLVSGLLDLPGQALAGLLGVLGWLRRAPGRLWRWLRSLRGDDEDDEDETAVDDETDTGEQVVAEREPTSLRERWRAFARWVSPRGWRQRTPGEVAREAVDAGFPDDAVETLTAVFRDVEYGNVPLSEQRREQAREAFEALAAYRRESAHSRTGERRRRRSADGGENRRSVDGSERPRPSDGERPRSANSGGEVNH